MKSGDARRMPLRLSRSHALLGPPALLLTPLVIFFRHHGYSLMHPEALICLAGFFLVGLILGLPGFLGGRYPTILVLAALITLVVDIQWQVFQHWDYSVLGVFAASVLILWLLTARIGAVVAVMLWALLAASVLIPGESRLQDWQSETTGVDATPSLPVVLHIVLDEQIGVEGIPSRFDPGGGIAETMRSFYREHGFQLFGRAYSRYYESEDSISNLLNFSHNLEPSSHYHGDFDDGISMKRNAYFDEMTRRGYRLQVYQSDYMDFCWLEKEEGERVAAAAACHEYALETISSIEHTPLAVREKARLILAMFSRLSFLSEEIQKSYVAASRALSKQGVPLPEWEVGMGRVSSVSAMAAFERMQEDIQNADRGSLFFAHLLLPHYPYAYDRSCELQPNMMQWWNGFAALKVPRRNNKRSRDFRYPFYLEQMLCTQQKLAALFDALKSTGHYDDAIIIVHGDHGSRIDRGPRKRGVTNPFVDRDFIDGYSTLYAIKLPGQPAAYDRRVLPIDEIFTRHIRVGELPSGIDWAPLPLVHISPRGTLVNRRNKSGAPRPPMVSKRLPNFANGKISDPSR